MRTITQLACFVALFLLSGLAAAQKSGPVTEDQAFQIGVDAYIYGFPIYEMYRTRQPITARGLNVFFHRRVLSGPEARNVVSPNNDTLYSSAWLDLAGTPLVLEVPDTQDRYYCIQFMDIFTNNFAYIGRRTTGTKAGTYLIAGPHWKGAVPAGVKLIRSPTNTVWALGRFLVKDDADLPAVNALQDQLKLTPLAAWTTHTEAPKAEPHPTIPPDPKNDLDFFAVVNRALDENPPPAREAALMKRFAKIGVGPDRGSEDRSAAVIAGLHRAVPAARAKIQERVMHEGVQVNGWNVWRIPHFGHWGSEYLLRASIAYQGLAANDREENTSSVARTDGEGHPLDGTKQYTIHFPKGQLPPVDAFWSITLYDKDYFMVPNVAKRYSIGDRTKGLKMGADGSLDIYIQRDSPGADQESNWLPSPEGIFYLALRCYQPRAPILNGTYKTPPVLLLLHQ